MIERLWDAGMNLVYSSEGDPRTPEQFMSDCGFAELNLTIDTAEKSFRTRWGGKLVTGDDGKTFERIPNFDHLPKMMPPANPFVTD